jgi:hypothetical protein
MRKKPMHYVIYVQPGLLSQEPGAPEQEAPPQLIVEMFDDKSKALDCAAASAAGGTIARPVVIAGHEITWKSGAVEVRPEGAKRKRKKPAATGAAAGGPPASPPAE